MNIRNKDKFNSEFAEYNKKIRKIKGNMLLRN